MGPPPRHRNKLTNYNGDIHRTKLVKYAEDGHWFSTTEASKALKVKPHIIRKYIHAMEKKGYLKARKRQHSLPSCPPIEYSYRDNWLTVIESNNPIVKKHVKRLQYLADVYRQGQFPISDSIDDALHAVNEDIIELGACLDLLTMLVENPDLRKVNTFVKRMS